MKSWHSVATAVLSAALQAQQVNPDSVIIADVEGRILLLNEAFEQQLRASHPHLLHLRDLSSYFAAPAEFRANLEDLLGNKRSWRGEVQINSKGAQARSLMVRADPVIGHHERVLAPRVELRGSHDVGVRDRSDRRGQHRPQRPRPQADPRPSVRGVHPCLLKGDGRHGAAS